MESDLPLRAWDPSAQDLGKARWGDHQPYHRPYHQFYQFQDHQRHLTASTIVQAAPQLNAALAGWPLPLDHAGPADLVSAASCCASLASASPTPPGSSNHAAPATSSPGGDPLVPPLHRTTARGIGPAGTRAAPRPIAAVAGAWQPPSRSLPPVRVARPVRCSSASAARQRARVPIRKAEPKSRPTPRSLQASSTLRPACPVDGATPVRRAILPALGPHVYLASIARSVLITDLAATEHAPDAQSEPTTQQLAPNARSTPPPTSTITELPSTPAAAVKEEYPSAPLASEIQDEFFNPPSNDMSDSESEIIDDSETDLTGDLIISDEKKIVKYYEDRFKLLQQIPCKSIAKDWIKAIEPKKQARYPYNGGKIAKKSTGSQDETGKDPGELTKPPWWPPEGCPHREPDHIHKHQRLVLLMHLLRKIWLPDDIKNRKPYQCVDASVLRKSTEKTAQAWAHQKKYEDNARYLEEIYEMRYYEEQYRCGGYNLNTTITFRLSPSTKQDPKRQPHEFHFIEPEIIDPQRDPNRAYRPVTVTSPLRQEYQAHTPPNRRLTLPPLLPTGNQSSRQGTQPDQYQSRNSNLQKSHFPLPIATAVDEMNAAPTWFTSARSPTRKRSAGTMTMGEHGSSSASVSHDPSESQAIFPDRSRHHRNSQEDNAHRRYEETPREPLPVTRLPSLASSIPGGSSYPHSESPSDRHSRGSQLGGSVANWPFTPLPMPNHQPPPHNWADAHQHGSRNRESFPGAPLHIPPIASIHREPSSPHRFELSQHSHQTASTNRWQ